tara:strand:- start:530 stop:1534 length:1005 start_codon:yes stop_codon:yes gene_type:complete
MNVIEYGRNNRPFMWSFEEYLLSQLKPEMEPFHKPNCEDYLGRNFSYLIIEEEGNNYLILLDASDGCGMQPYDESLIAPTLRNIMEKHDVKNYLVFKMQYSKKLTDHYQLKERTFPLGYFPDFPEETYEWKEKTKYYYFAQKEDIDFFWAGSIDYKSQPTLWPSNKSIGLWPINQRRIGFKKIKEIADKHPEWNIVVSDTIKYDRLQYLDLIMRSKVCLDLPGVGYFTTRFFENLILERCILTQKLPLDLPYKLEPNKHYASVNNWDHLEDKMISLMESPLKREEIIKNVKDVGKKLTHAYAYKKMMQKVKKMIDVDTFNKRGWPGHFNASVKQ